MPDTILHTRHIPPLPTAPEVRPDMDAVPPDAPPTLVQVMLLGRARQERRGVAGTHVVGVTLAGRVGL